MMPRTKVMMSQGQSLSRRIRVVYGSSIAITTTSGIEQLKTKCKIFQYNIYMYIYTHRLQYVRRRLTLVDNISRVVPKVLC